MIRSRFVLPILALLLMLTGISAVPHQSTVPDTFPNGHTLQEPFLSFYRSAPDAELLFGQPITEQITRDAPKKVVMQFFERARMEYDPGLPSDKRVVTLADIGAYVYDKSVRGTPPDFPVNNSVCRSFPPDGYLVCYAFLQFYENHSGPIYFGKPISNVEWMDGRMVQYFERARMEWHPDMREGQRVVLTELGRIDFDIRIGDTNLLKAPSANDNTIESTPLKLLAYAFVEKPLLATGQSQTVYVVVRDQNGRPVQNAQVEVTLTYPDKHPDNKPPATTDSDGLAQIDFIPDKTDPNQIIKIEVQAVLRGDPVRAWTWFRTWW